MNAYAELRMPAHYVDMSQKEMEYDGGWSLGSLFGDKWRRVIAVGAALGAVSGLVVATVIMGGTILLAIAIGAASGACTGSIGYLIDCFW